MKIGTESKSNSERKLRTGEQKSIQVRKSKKPGPAKAGPGHTCPEINSKAVFIDVYDILFGKWYIVALETT